MFETYQRQLRHPCQEVTSALQSCYIRNRRNGGEKDGGETCTREELDHKKCLAELLCHREAYRFYNERKIPLNGSKWLWRGGGGNGSNISSSDVGRGDKTTCAILVEAFAKPENEMDIPEGVGKEDREHCRTVVMDLAECMARKTNKSGM